MQELRLVFIIIGGLAIAGLLVHGILKSKKEAKSKFADKPLHKMEPELSSSISEEELSSNTQVDAQSSERIEPEFGGDITFENSVSEDIEPLFGSSDLPFTTKHQFSSFEQKVEEEIEKDPLTESSVSDLEGLSIKHQKAEQGNITSSSVNKYENAQKSINSNGLEQGSLKDKTTQALSDEEAPAKAPKEQDSNDIDVIVFHVHVAGDGYLNGSELFPSMKQNCLLYGAMDIFHRHTDTSGTGKVLFSVANMMKPGTLVHDAPQSFNTKGISFFMTLPCFGEPDQNFKLMLRTAQQIADDLGANVLDDKRNLMTPDRIAAYRQQIRDFVAREQPQ